MVDFEKVCSQKREIWDRLFYLFKNYEIIKYNQTTYTNEYTLSNGYLIIENHELYDVYEKEYGDKLFRVYTHCLDVDNGDISKMSELYKNFVQCELRPLINKKLKKYKIKKKFGAIRNFLCVFLNQKHR